MHKKQPINKIHRSREKALGLLELIAIALGGMVGGGIFTILGISVSKIGAYTPFAIIIGGVIAAFASYSYIKLGVYFQDEGASYSFFKRVFISSPFAAALIGWWVIFGYISTIALYSYTFASYALSDFSYFEDDLSKKVVATGIILFFTSVNIMSVKGMGRMEDLMVYSKLLILAIISIILTSYGSGDFYTLLGQSSGVSVLDILIVSSITFVAYEGFQLVVNAVNEMSEPEKKIPKAIYSAIGIAVVIYFFISVGAILSIPFEDIIRDKESALANGAANAIGKWASWLVVLGALLATSSAISGTLFGASRQFAVIAHDGYFPQFLAKRENGQPVRAILAMALFSILLVLIGNLQLILEFGSITFLLVSVLMAVSNFKIRRKTESSPFILCLSLIVLSVSTLLIFYYEATSQVEQLYFIIGLYLILTISAFIYSRIGKTHKIH